MISETRGRFQIWLYNKRGSSTVWFSLAALSVGLAFVVLVLLRWVNETWFAGEKWFTSTGPWTFILVVGSSPVAWFIWFIRDRNKARELEVAQNQINASNVEHAWGIFRQLQEWATGEDDALQAAAIHQLRPFILGRAEGPIPTEAMEGGNPFAQPGLEILRSLLDDRTWERRWEYRLRGPKNVSPFGIEISQSATGSSPNSEGVPENSVGSAPRSPVTRAIEAILQDPELPTRNFSGWNFSKLEFSQVRWENAVLNRANLAETIFLDADLSGADFRHADLTGVGLWYADLTGADFLDANLTGARLGAANLGRAKLWRANLTRAELFETDLRKADLYGANLDAAELKGTNLDGAWIGKQWKALVNGGEGVKGTPMYMKELDNWTTIVPRPEPEDSEVEEAEEDNC